MERDMQQKKSDNRPHLLKRRNFLAVACVGVAAVAAIRSGYLTPPDHDNSRLTVTEAYQAARNGQLVLIDIRTPREWRSTGVPDGAHMIDMRRDDFTDALDRIVMADKGAPVALICARGVRSARMTLRLTEAGFTNILDVPEGMLGSKAGPGWIKSNLPVKQWDG